MAEPEEPTLDLRPYVQDLLRRVDQELALLWQVKAQIEGLLDLLHGERARLETLRMRVAEDTILTALNALMADHCQHYVLEWHTPVRVYDFLAWAAWYAQTDRHVAHDEGEGWELSTVFFFFFVHRSRDEAAREEVPPLFETCLFRDDGGAQVLARYRTWEEAAQGHAALLSGCGVTGTPQPLSSRRPDERG